MISIALLTSGERTPCDACVKLTIRSWLWSVVRDGVGGGGLGGHRGYSSRCSSGRCPQVSSLEVRRHCAGKADSGMGLRWSSTERSTRLQCFELTILLSSHLHVLSVLRRRKCTWLSNVHHRTRYEYHSNLSLTSIVSKWKCCVHSFLLSWFRFCDFHSFFG
jgi:hypothetical protein